MKQLLLFTLGLLPVLYLSQNNPPVIFEALTGNRGFASQMTINKGFQDIKGLGFFSVANISSKWSEEVSKDAMIQANLTFELVKKIRLVGGMHYTPATGLRPTGGLLYSLTVKNFLFTINPRFIGFSKSSIAEGFLLIEYKPVINDRWQGYSRIQALYSETIKDGEHARSYLMVRVGVSYKVITFGLGGNWDRYGPYKESKENYGIFAAFRLFH
ncbi:hypothetical protein C1637_20030 [Chryseobacterium lactis]|uniref:YaiO family outer membrane beta-barrel protein n=1 Tax=Chryseobacterium lactis TaxID=1241981 RepID=A0A3G6RED9_CHRLC|nr:hypothetical protein [Chryseobacterium lactis]AZA83068.1 hypothetical protein EG342_14785 [Chryseobacterium lactis]AZB03451.1 hypothetical protein EG341_05655 [Chryseobacterium lactis]PNW12045.1 hypothetical protein C1637_20030 [Chryseobacterium lactis]